MPYPNYKGAVLHPVEVPRSSTGRWKGQVLAPTFGCFNESAGQRSEPAKMNQARVAYIRTGGASAGTVWEGAGQRRPEDLSNGWSVGYQAAWRKYHVEARDCYTDRASACNQLKMKDNAHEASCCSQSSQPSHPFQIGSAPLEQSFGPSVAQPSSHPLCLGFTSSPRLTV
jgi:hypothetical protein